MKINFTVKGRLGNAIFRYLASTILCIYYNCEYVVNNIQNNNCSDELFCLITNNKDKIFGIISFNMTGYYQHDSIYKNNKKSLKKIITKLQNH